MRRGIATCSVAALTVLAGCAGPGAWTAEPVPVPPSPGGTASDVAMEHVACVAPDACVAVGAVQQPDGQHVATWRWDGSSWAPPLVDPVATGPLDSLSCPSVTFCVATRGGALVMWTGGTWSGATADGAGTPIPAAAAACATTSSCLAVAAGGTHRWDGASWRAAGPGPDAVGPLTASTFRSLDCGTAGTCAALGAEPGGVTVEHVWLSGSWRRIAFAALPPGTTVDDLACVPAVGPCIIVGRHPDRPGGVAYAGGLGTWSDLELPPVPTAHPLRVECGAGTACVVLRADGPGAVHHVGAWSVGPVPPPGSALDAWCTGGWCIVVGGHLTATEGLQPASATVAW